ncbi:hypothetical protein QQS21_000576 [Conoideocrella luteorostrata]|uniref:non-specific serine/threonine protein kinase n=1 Tax=Conoideocrella luteorostrata TaxID=1105319 RepID=A0AAJ0CYX3_9HYPO|nr:hypothetical protein QQS21_000576 [Conoideocrella luteorostrata]
MSGAGQDRTALCQALQRFAAFVSEVKCEGTNGLGQQQSYVSYVDLEQYWDDRNVRDVLKSLDKPVTYLVKTVQERYLRNFSLLVYSDKVEFLQAFVEQRITDDHLARRDLPKMLDAPTYRALRTDVLEHQWLFHPLIINWAQLSGVCLPDQIIVPIHSQTVIKESDSCIIKKAVVRVWHHPSYPVSQTKIPINLVPKSPYRRNEEPQKVDVIIKSYFPQFQNHYLNEHNALAAVQELRNENIVGYYGSFVQNRMYNLVLQYVDGGNLADYFTNTPKPTTSDDIRRFWRSICSVWKGLHGLHHFDGAGVTNLGIVHEDLKPDNILIAKKEDNSSSVYDFVPVIADFGHSYVKSVPNGRSDMAVPDRHGNHDFAAPEASHHAKYTLYGPCKITATADVWAMGCILSIAAVWVGLGTKGIDLYNDMRVLETDSLSNFEDNGHLGCFHNGSERLSAVDNMCDMATKSCGGNTVTPKVIKVLLDHSIVGDPKSRKSARYLHETLCNTINEEHPPSPLPLCRDDPSNALRIESENRSRDDSKGSGLPATSGSSNHHSPRHSSSSHTQLNISSHPRPNGTALESTPRAKRVQSPGAISPPSRDSFSSPGSNIFRDFPRPMSSQCTSRTPQANTTLTIQQCHEWVEAKKGIGDINKYVDGAIHRLREFLKGREQVFLVDDSPEMHKHKDELRKTIRTLTYIAKPMDPNRVELIFASQPSVVHQPGRLTRSSQPLLDAFDKCQFSGVDGSMEHSLGVVVNSIIKKKLQPHKPRVEVSLFIFTNGQWGNDKIAACGVERPIQKLMDVTRKYDDRTRVMVQFIRFGDDLDGQRHLRYLDTFGKEKGWDIVDSKAIATGNVFTMFTGSIIQKGDDEDEDEPEML